MNTFRKILIATLALIITCASTAVVLSPVAFARSAPLTARAGALSTAVAPIRASRL